MLGDVIFMGNAIYVQVNEGGTLMRLGKPRWWRVLSLFILRAFGGMRHPKEVIDYLTPWRRMRIFK